MEVAMERSVPEELEVPQPVLESNGSKDNVLDAKSKNKKNRAKEALVQFAETKAQLDEAEALLTERDIKLQELEAQLSLLTGTPEPEVDENEVDALKSRVKFLEEELQEKEGTLANLECEAEALDTMVQVSKKKHKSWNGAVHKLRRAASKQGTLLSGAEHVEDIWDPNASKLRDVEEELMRKEEELEEMNRMIEEKDQMMHKWSLESENMAARREEAAKSISAQEELIKELQKEKEELPGAKLAPLIEEIKEKDDTIAALRHEISTLKESGSELKNLAARSACTASIANTRCETDSGGKFTQYEVTAVVNGEDCGKIWKRYSEFHKLESDLKEVHRGVPELKAWRRLWGHLDAEVVEDRRVKLEEWFNHIITNKALSSSAQVKRFCGLPTSSA